MKFISIADLGEVVSGSTPKTDVSEYWDGDILWATPKDLSGLKSPYISDTSRKITQQGVTSCATKVLPTNSILFSSRAPIGLLAIAEKPISTNQGFKSIILNDGFYPLYIYYTLKYFTPRLQQLGTGTTFKELSKATIERFEIPVPDLSTQVRIATLLYKIDTTIQKRKKSLIDIELLTESLFNFYFGSSNLTNENWATKKIGEVCNVTKLAGYEYSKFISYQDSGPIAMIRGLNVKYGELRLKDVKYIEDDISSQLVRSKLFINDVVMTYIGVNIGDVALIRENNRYHLGPNVAKITPINDKEVNSIYLLIYLMLNRALLSQGATNTAKQALNMENIREISIVVPNIKIQNKFSSEYERIRKIKLDATENLEYLNLLFNSVTQKAYNGELDLSSYNVSALESELTKIEPVKKATQQVTEKQKIKKKITTSKNKILWENVSVEQAANWIKSKYQDHDFSIEMLVRYFTDDLGIVPNYYSSSQLRLYPYLNESDDFKSLIFSAINNENSFMRITQFFYNSLSNETTLNLTDEDLELISKRPIEDQSGIYFQLHHEIN